MNDTIQVVRVEDVQRLFPVTTEIEDGQLWAVLGDLANEYRVGDVIELTVGNPVRRVVSDGLEQMLHGWVVVDEDS